MVEDPVRYHSENAEAFAADHPFEEKPDAFVRLLDRFVDLVGDGRVLDAGCGPGHEVDYFVRQGMDAVGVDAAEGMIAHARAHSRGEFRRMDLRDLEFDDGSFDGVWCNTTMQFFPPQEMERALDEFDRVLRSGGVFYVTFKMGEGSVVTGDYGMEVERYLVPEDRARAMVAERGYEILDADRSELEWGLEVLNLFARKARGR